MMKMFHKLCLEIHQVIFLEILIMARDFNLKKHFNSFTINKYNYNNNNNNNNKLILNN